MISIVLPIYIPSDKHRRMTEKCIFIAKNSTRIECEWIIVETCSKYFIDESDIYIYEKSKSTPNRSINRGLKMANGEYVVFLANDVEVCDGWVEKMIDCFDRFDDCGLASLGNNEFGDCQEDRIVERPYFSVCMFKKENAYLDPNYVDLFDDSDFIMRIYSQGKKAYQNLSGIVHHNPHSTYGRNDLSEPKNIEQRRYFENKWSKYKETEVYKLFA